MVPAEVVRVACAISYEHPYTLARRFSTLDHLTGGRIGWNIVTGCLNNAAKGMGLAWNRRLVPDELIRHSRQDAQISTLEAFTISDPDRYGRCGKLQRWN